MVVTLSEFETGLLAHLFSACDGRTLSKLEIVLGAELGRSVCSSELFRWTWVHVLQAEGGVSLANVGRSLYSKCCFNSAPSVMPLKDALQLAQASLPIAGGWAGVEPTELVPCASTLGRLHCTFPEGRNIKNCRTGKDWGAVERLALAHFDARYCFSDTSWDMIVTSFRRNAQLLPDVPTCVRSTPVSCIVCGSTLKLALILSCFPEQRLLDEGPRGGIFFGLDVSCFARYFEDTSQDFFREQDVLHVVCTISFEGLTRKSDHILMYISGRGVVDVSSRPFWRLVPLPNFGLALSIEVQESGEDASASLLIDEEVSNSHWNNDIPEGTDMVPLVALVGNEFALDPIPADDLSGVIALVRRGGGCGFAQKALAVQAAGAVGCIIYEAQGDRETLGEVHTMGLRYAGVDYPAPSIPCVMVHAADGKRLLNAACSSRVPRAQINFGRLDAELRRPPQSFETFREIVSGGASVHTALLIERVRRPDLPSSVQDAEIPQQGSFGSLEF